MDQIVTFLQNQNPIAIAAVAAALAGAYFLKTKKKSGYKYEKDIVYVIAIGPTDLQVPHPSPFALKVILFLKLANVPYKVIYSMDRGERNKMPYVYYNGEHIYDSHFIIKQLAKKLNMTNLFQTNDQERANEILIRRFIDEAVYWPLVYYRWVDEKTNETHKFFVAAPKWIVPLIKPRLLAGVKNQCYQAGISRYTEEERVSLINDDMFALSTILGNKTYLFGDQIGYSDISMFSMLAEMWTTDIPTPARNAILTHPNLVEYIERIKTKYFSVDWDQSLTTTRKLKNKSKQQ
ncbi:glutathione S-transferase domain-containing protein [Cavenderia fasciculata]|uniref:Glutathione S-transferase domain-containing protein n=1 Tax=Cavenderia fasciculata TaxID=261658 RepID=F4QE34_CACFS|nr:glutathione S-transferase domain-containing protein [Cavenderia fasciculata]EGG13981.1 glutathione S-transferase domain-containing protein [Cavenderia fasciculata]|eukprot:XP_004350689.1 glutathione S-transferase domain-containing protein [Cavenderia fasciculata]